MQGQSFYAYRVLLVGAVTANQAREKDNEERRAFAGVVESTCRQFIKKRQIVKEQTTSQQHEPTLTLRRQKFETWAKERRLRRTDGGLNSVSSVIFLFR